MVFDSFLIVRDTVDMVAGRKDFVEKNGVFSALLLSPLEVSITNTGPSFELHAPYILYFIKQ
jgi:hypothetical protein